MNRFAAIHQFHPGTAHGDAITQQMLQLQVHIRRMGVPSQIFAVHVEPGLEDRIKPIQGYEGSEENLLLVHHSLGSHHLDEVMELPDRIAAVFHNLTPERYFADESFRDLVRLGHEQLAQLARRACVGVADSNYNRREMLAVGFRRVEVLPVRVDYSQFSGLCTDPTMRSTDWLYVGRIVGNKCQHELVRAFALYARTFDHEARLVLIGDTKVRDYVARVEGEADRCGIADRVVMLGKVSDSRLGSAFAGAGVFVSMSEHEGFGVPILEAMAAGLPVVAFGAAAVPEVMGGAGILLRNKDPELVAATVQALRTDPALRERLVERQLVRVEQVQAFDVAALLERVVEKAAGAEPDCEVQVQGPFETSYSLAVTNREIALALDKLPDRALSIYATEGPGDYEPDPTDLARHPEATKLFERAREVPYPDVVIRQMWPPRVIDSPGGITCEFFGWEESRIPQAMADDFNLYLAGVGVMSTFVRDVLQDSGVDIPVHVVGIGVPRHDPLATVDAPELEGLRNIRFLHVSSAFPRKGVDVLLEAYFSVFSGSDDTTLVLKTFPNPHNEVADLLAKHIAAHPNPPDVRWIDRDLDDHEIMGLHNLASCYVHPARGEGFGLPVAEAMAAGVPVVTLAYSGLADFVSDDTATTIPFVLEPARTHLSVPGSVWAEPDCGRLAAEMRAFADDPERPDLKLKAERARELIESDFSWDAVARRWDSFISSLELASQVPRVAMVSTWNSRCGVAENTRNIVENAAGSVNFEIFADTQAETIDPEQERGVVRSWVNRWNPGLGALDGALDLSDPDVVHFQFNFGFFELQAMAGLINRQLERRAVVMTLHRTRDIDIDGELVSLSSIRHVLEQVDRLIVHQASDARILAEMGISANVSVVPMGTAAPPKVSHTEARKMLNLGSRPLIGTFGFLLPHKGTIELVQAIASLRDEFPDICLIALCAHYPDITSDSYEERLRKEIESLGLADNVMLITDYLPDESSRTILRGMDTVVLPYQNTGESSSAALRFVMPTGRPIIVTDQPIFEDCRDSVLAVDPTDPTAMQDALRRVLVDPGLQRDLADRAALAARRFRWSRIVNDHREIYAAARAAHGRRQARRERRIRP
ncbi:MAG: glycosyltransferase [Acidimicrobiales bacterium]